MTKIEIEQLKASYPIENVIGETVKLERKGTNYVGLCPFHEDHHPSLRLIVGVHTVTVHLRKDKNRDIGILCHLLESLYIVSDRLVRIFPPLLFHLDWKSSTM